MDKKLKRGRRRFQINRMVLLALFFVFLSGVLIQRLYTIQIINGEGYRNSFAIKTTKTRALKSTRGNIYDRNGKLLAGNRLSYSLTIEDAGTYKTTRERVLALNTEAYRISKILQAHGDSLSNDFHVVLDENGNYTYNCSGRTLDRFKADVYGKAKISDLTEEQANSTAEEMMATLVSEKGFGIVRIKKPYTEEELTEAGFPLKLNREEILDIIYVRYQLFTTQYRKYMPVTIATNISDESVAALSEESDTLTGIAIVEDTTRVYTNAVPFASLIGYIGKVSSEDLTELQSTDSNYNRESIVGKSGIEKVMEHELQGSGGQESVYVDRFGKVLQIDEAATIKPTAGSNVYLTIDSDLQNAIYKILEQRIAGVLENVIIDAESFDSSTVTDTASIRIPIFDVYNAIINNGVLDISVLSSEDASDAERSIYSIFTKKQEEVFASIRNQLTGTDSLPYNELSDEMKEYESYIVNDLLMSSTKILDSSKIDKTDETYLAWTRDETISLRAYLTYAASKNWIDISAISSDEETYLDSAETYDALSAYIAEYLATDTKFSKILYKYLITSRDLSGALIINALYDQGLFSKKDGTYAAFKNDEMKAYDVVISKIHSLELTPAMLALDPCSGSVVVTDPNTGEILACVTYPGYDNNRLTNTMDITYYNKLAQDASGPFYNKATQQETAPGSTFKLITTTAGLEEKVITGSTVFNCTGTFSETETPLRCWLTSGHGPLNIIGGIQNSCNVFFCNVAFQLGINEEGSWSDSLSLSKLQQYAELFNMDQPSGIEVPENEPHVSDQYAIQSSIGQGTHAYTTTQLARYITTLANGGTSYNISMIDKTTDAEGNTITDYTPTVASQLSISTFTWDTIHEGMRAVIENKDVYADMPIAVAGKTGTAQESKSRPSHALFVCYAPYENPEIAMAVRIGNGYSSTNCLMTAKDILQYYFKLNETSSIITGHAMTDSVNAVNVD
ncbi:MAG: penicillin-binding transpeptidase domain-containing protein [Lachnospiraceae bacterium]|nr:penicillin-binding transpeptidase domain-containing protein [Lachnospiraceae bacterium]